jgi:rhodanese-related sulfurtransferase
VATAYGLQRRIGRKPPIVVGMADDAVRELRQHGYRAARLEDGFPEWRRAGLPVAIGPS